LLYVESTISPTVVVEQKAHALSGWNIELLKKRQSLEIKDGGFGLLPIRSTSESSEDINHKNIGETSTPTHLNKEDHVQRILIKIVVVLSARVEAEMEIKEAMSKFPDDENFKQYKKQLYDMFNEGACNTTHDTHFSGLKDHSTAKNDGQPSLDIVVSQPSGLNEKPLPKIWLSLGFIEAVDKVLENTISTSKTELLFSTPNDTKLHRHAIGSLGRTTTIYGDSKLRSKSINHNTQYALFKKGLLSSVKNNWEVVQMRNVDLVFFPLLDKGHYYLVVFNLKNPSVVVIDNIYQEVPDDDQLLQMYDFITDILQRLMIRHLNAVGHPVGRELDEIGQERLRMDWQTQNNFDDCGVFPMRHMETYMGDVRTWKTGLG
ncbi:Peptidase C48, SUMO/Sentrin/Ubl1, partial [Cynara cardunculus var. scolymus]